MVISQEERQRVSGSVAEAERGTTGEIVPVVAEQSGRYDRAEDLFGLCVALVALTAVWLLSSGVEVEEGAWSEQWVPTPRLPWMLLALVVGFAFGTFLAGRWPALRRPFVGKRQIREEVARSAAAAFHRFRVRRTAQATGVLIYVSLYERVVRVTGDETVAAALSQADWDDVRDAVLAGVRAGDLASGLVAGIGVAGERLREHFPGEDSGNELHNELRIFRTA